MESWVAPTVPILVTVPGLTIGNSYYMMIDGNFGDVADYTILGHEGFDLSVDVTPSDSTFCLGESIDLSASGGDGSYVWSPATNLSGTNGTTVTATPSAAGSITYTATSVSGNPLCPNPTFATAALIVVDCVALPIELINFSVLCEKGNSTLKWSTSTEYNNERFVIEKSENGIDFEIIGNITGAGYSTVTLNYTFTDNDPVRGTSYYRLSQIDYDGTKNILGIRAFEWPCDSDFDGLLVYPNPSSENVNLAFSLGNNDAYTVELFNTAGQLVYQLNEGSSDLPDATLVTIDTKDYSQGVYMVRVVVGNRIFVERFIKE